MADRYILDENHVPVECPDLMEWAKWFEAGDRKVAKDMIGDSEVSTVFLGLDHQWGDGPPMIFETMVFGGPLGQDQDRYSTWDDAIKGHKNMIEKVNKAV